MPPDAVTTDARLPEGQGSPWQTAKTSASSSRAFTSMAHRANVWVEPPFQPIVLGALAWVLGRVDVDVTPNIDRVTPAARQLRS